MVSEANAGCPAFAGTLNFRAQFSSASIPGHLAESWMIPFEHSLVNRRPAAYKGQYNFAELWWRATNRLHVRFESWCEHYRLMRSDFDPDLAGVATRPFRITLPAALPQTTHVPDYFVRQADGTGVVAPPICTADTSASESRSASS